MEQLKSLLQQCINRLKPTVVENIEIDNAKWIKNQQYFWAGSITGAAISWVFAAFITDIIPDFPTQFIPLLLLAPLPGMIYTAYAQHKQYKERQETYQIAYEMEHSSPHWASLLINKYALRDNRLTDEEARILLNTPLSATSHNMLNHATSQGFLTYQDLWDVYRQQEQEQHLIHNQSSFIEKVQGNTQHFNSLSKKFNTKNVL